MTDVQNQKTAASSGCIVVLHLKPGSTTCLAAVPDSDHDILNHLRIDATTEHLDPERAAGILGDIRSRLVGKDYLTRTRQFLGLAAIALVAVAFYDAIGIVSRVRSAVNSVVSHKFDPHDIARGLSHTADWAAAVTPERDEEIRTNLSVIVRRLTPYAEIMRPLWSEVPDTATSTRAPKTSAPPAR